LHDTKTNLSLAPVRNDGKLLLGRAPSIEITRLSGVIIMLNKF